MLSYISYIRIYLTILRCLPVYFSFTSFTLDEVHLFYTDYGFQYQTSLFTNIIFYRFIKVQLQCIQLQPTQTPFSVSGGKKKSSLLDPLNHAQLYTPSNNSISSYNVLAVMGETKTSLLENGIL